MARRYPGPALGEQTDDDRDPAVAQVQRVSPTLRAVADDRAGFVEERREIDVFIGENSRFHKPRLGAADSSGADSTVNPASRRGRRLVRERAGGAADRFEARDLSDGVFGLGLLPHFFQDIREQSVLEGRVWLPRHRPLLRAISLDQTILAEAHLRD